MRRITATLLATLSIFAASCDKKKTSEPFVVIGNDTLRATQLQSFAADSLTDKASLLSAARLRVLVCQGLTPDTSMTVVNDLADLVEQETGVKWPAAATQNLLAGVRALAAIEASGAGVAATLDSLGKHIGTTATIPSDTSKRLTSLLSWLFPDPRHATAVADFLASESLSSGTAANTDALVTGLVSDGKAAKNNSLTRATAKVAIADKTGEALKFRSETSIRDTIARHLPYLEGIYRKTLKLDPDMSGTVVVKFTIAASGATSEARVTKTAIDRTELLDQITAYAHGIAFAPVPDKAGSMSFEFPFEFHPE